MWRLEKEKQDIYLVFIFCTVVRVGTLKSWKSHFLNKRIFFFCVSLCWPDVSPLPHKGLIICTSRSWETSLEETHGAYSDRVRSIVQMFFVLHSIGESAAFAPTYLLFFLTSCLDVKKREPQKSSQGREAAWAAYTCCATDLQRRGESMEDGGGGGGDLAHGSKALPGRRQLVHMCKCTRVPSQFNSWQIQNRISFTIYDLPNETIFFSDVIGVSRTRRRSVSSVCFWSRSRSTCAFGKKKKIKKERKKKENLWLLGRIWKARCPPPEDDVAGLFPHKRTMFTFGKSYHWGKLDVVVVKFN